MELWTRLDELDRYDTYETCIDLRTQIRHLKLFKKISHLITLDSFAILRARQVL